MNDDQIGSARTGQPSDRASLGQAMLLDGLNLMLHALAYGLAVSPLLLLLAAASSFAGIVLAVLLGALAGGLVFLLAVALLVRLVAPPGAEVHEYRLGAPNAIAWGMAMMAFILFRKSAIRHLIHLFVLPRQVFYRLLGGSIHYSAVLGTNVDITDPWATQIAPQALLGDYSFLNAHEIRDGQVYCAPIRIERGATVGHHVCIGPGVTVEAGAVVASGAVVPRNARVPGREVWGGIPARRIHGAAGPTQH